MNRARNHIVLGGSRALINEASYEMIPGLQLVDRDFTLRYDSTVRTNQRHDLYRELLPGVRKLLTQVPFTGSAASRLVPVPGAVREGATAH